MAVVALASAKGAPGTTTAALGLAAVWPRPAILVEADPAGGDLAARFGTHRSPGLAEWAADSRARTPHDGNPSHSHDGRGGRDGQDRWDVAPDVARYVQHLPGIEAGVVFGASWEQMPAAATLIVSAQALAGFANANRPDRRPRRPARGSGSGPAGAGEAPVDSGHWSADDSSRDSLDVLLDLGRLDFSSDILALAAQADLLLLVAGGWPDSVAALVSRREALLGELRARRVDGNGPRVGVLLVGSQPYTHAEIQAVVRLPVLGELPRDDRAADVLSGRRAPGRAWTRSPLLRACRSLAAVIHTDLRPGQPSDLDTSAEAVHRQEADRRPDGTGWASGAAAFLPTGSDPASTAPPSSGAPGGRVPGRAAPRWGGA